MMEKPSTAVLISKEAVRSDALQSPSPRATHNGDTGFLNQLEDAIAHLERAEKHEESHGEQKSEIRSEADASADRIREDRREENRSDSNGKRPGDDRSDASANRGDETRRADEDRKSADAGDREKRTPADNDKRSDALKGDIRELLALGKKAEKFQPTVKTESEKTAAETGPRARVVERFHSREGAETAAALFQLRREPVRENAKEVKTEGEEKKNIAGRSVKESRERTMSLPQEAIVQEKTSVKRESTAQDNSVIVRLNTEKWSVNGNAGTEQQQSQQQKHGRGERDPRDIAAERRVHLANREVRTESADANTRTMFLDSMNSLRDPLRGMDRLEEKARVAADNRNLFNELVEKARLNLGADGRSSASIRMRPEALGTMTLNLRMQEGHLDAKLVVESKSAHKVMMEEIEHLKAELRAQGIQVDSFSIHIRESAESQQSETRRDPDAFQRAGENPEKNPGGNFREGDRRENERRDGDFGRDVVLGDDREQVRPIDAQFEHVVLAGSERSVNISV